MGGGERQVAASMGSQAPRATETNGLAASGKYREVTYATAYVELPAGRYTADDLRAILDHFERTAATLRAALVRA